MKKNNVNSIFFFFKRAVRPEFQQVIARTINDLHFQREHKNQFQNADGRNFKCKFTRGCDSPVLHLLGCAMSAVQFQGGKLERNISMCITITACRTCRLSVWLQLCCSYVYTTVNTRDIRQVVRKTGGEWTGRKKENSTYTRARVHTHIYRYT